MFSVFDQIFAAEKYVPNNGACGQEPDGVSAHQTGDEARRRWRQRRNYGGFV